MKRYFIFFVSIILSLFAVQTNAQNQSKVDYPEVPRVSAYEAYVKYKAGKAIILFGGGDHYSKRHIMGSFNLDVKNRDDILVKFPKEGIEIFTYCYWGENESGGAGLASYMIEKGFKNVKTVRDGGAAMEKFFDHYVKTYYGGKIINPATGKEFDVKPWSFFITWYAWNPQNQ